MGTKPVTNWCPAAYDRDLGRLVRCDRAEYRGEFTVYVYAFHADGIDSVTITLDDGTTSVDGAATLQAIPRDLTAMQNATGDVFSIYAYGYTFDAADFSDDATAALSYEVVPGGVGNTTVDSGTESAVGDYTVCLNNGRTFINPVAFVKAGAATTFGRGADNVGWTPTGSVSYTSSTRTLTAGTSFAQAESPTTKYITIEVGGDAVCYQVESDTASTIVLADQDTQDTLPWKPQLPGGDIGSVTIVDTGPTGDIPHGAETCWVINRDHTNTGVGNSAGGYICLEPDVIDFAGSSNNPTQTATNYGVRILPTPGNAAPTLTQTTNNELRAEYQEWWDIDATGGQFDLTGTVTHWSAVGCAYTGASEADPANDLYTTTLPWTNGVLQVANAILIDCSVENVQDTNWTGSALYLSLNNWQGDAFKLKTGTSLVGVKASNLYSVGVKHTDVIQVSTTGSDLENVVLFGFDVTENINSQYIFMRRDGGGATANDSMNTSIIAGFVGNTDANLQQIQIPLENVIIENNVVLRSDGDVSFRIRDDSSGSPTTSLTDVWIRNNVFGQYLQNNTGTETRVTIDNNHYIAGTADAGDSNATTGGSAATLFEDFDNGDYTPIGDLLRTADSAVPYGINGERITSALGVYGTPPAAVTLTPTGTHGGDTITVTASAAVEWANGDGPTFSVIESNGTAAEGSPWGGTLVTNAALSTTTTFTVEAGNSDTLDSEKNYYITIDNSAGGMIRTSDSAPVESITEEEVEVSGPVSTGGRSRSRTRSR